jgi:hypothetical protein
MKVFWIIIHCNLVNCYCAAKEHADSMFTVRERQRIKMVRSEEKHGTTICVMLSMHSASSKQVKENNYTIPTLFHYMIYIMNNTNCVKFYK